MPATNAERRFFRIAARPLGLVRGCLAAAAILAASCRSPMNPGASPGGTWRGTIVDGVAGTGTATLNISQVGQGLTGSWTATFSAGPPTGGSLGGSTIGPAVSLFLTPETPIVCSTSTLSGTRSVTANLSGNRLTGSYVVLTCTGATDGTIDLTR